MGHGSEDGVLSDDGKKTELSENAENHLSGLVGYTQMSLPPRTRIGAPHAISEQGAMMMGCPHCHQAYRGPATHAVILAAVGTVDNPAEVGLRRWAAEVGCGLARDLVRLFGILRPWPTPLALAASRSVAPCFRTATATGFHRRMTQYASNPAALSSRDRCSALDPSRIAAYSRTRRDYPARMAARKEGMDMAVSVKRIVLWRSEVANKAGVAAAILRPLADAGADLRILMGYRYPGSEEKAAIELYPISGKKATTAAQQAGLAASPIPILLVEGDNKPGLGAAISEALADASVNLAFLVAHVIGRKYAAVVGFESEADAAKSAKLIRKAVAAKKK